MVALVLDLHKLDQWKTIIGKDDATQIWVDESDHDSDSDDDNDDDDSDDDDSGDSDDMDTD